MCRVSYGSRQVIHPVLQMQLVGSLSEARASKHFPRTCPMNALVVVVCRVYALSMAALSRRLRLVTVLEAVDRFCYLGDMLSAGGGCMAAATARCRCAWGKFRENLPLLTSKPVPFDLRCRLFSSNVRSSMLHGTETWPLTSAPFHRLCCNDRAMIRWICGVKPSDDPSMDELHAKLGICDLAILVRERRLRWFGHVMRSNGEINRVRSRPVPGRKGLDGRRRLGKSAWSKIWKYVVYLRPALRIDCRGDHLWRTVDRSLPRLTGAFLRAWLRLRHGAFWGCAPAPLTKLDLIDWLIEHRFR